MNSLLLTLTAVFILVLSALFAAPLFIDWNNYRPQFEAHASKLLGRPVKVDGKVHLIVLPAPQLKFDDIKVAGTSGDLETPFLEAKSLEAKLDVGTLLTGKIEAHELTVTDPILRLKLDEDGRGNWSDIGEHSQGTPFVPKDVLFDAVHIKGGTVEIIKDGGVAFVCRNVDGEASGASLAGPYKVSATYEFEGRPQKLRFSTGVIGDEGRVRMKAALRDPARSVSYQLDGMVAGLRASPSYDGSILMRINTREAEAQSKDGAEGTHGTQEAATQMQPAPRLGDGVSQRTERVLAQAEQVANGNDKTALRGVRETASFVELKGPLKVSKDGAELPEFDLTVHASGRPQILKGSLSLGFLPPYKADAKLAARWVDFDALLGAAATDARPAPAAVMVMFADWILDEAGRIGEGSLVLDIEQAGLGGDLAGALQVRLSSDPGGVTIEQLEATLPGENRVSATGYLSGGSLGPLFNGPVKIDGAGLRALTRWAAGDRAITGGAFIGDFALQADATIGDGRVEFANAKGAVSGTDFHGRFLYETGATNQIDIDLKSDRLDLREVLGDEPIWGAWLSRANTAEAQALSEASPQAGHGNRLLKLLRGDDVRAKVEVGELLLPDLAPGTLDAQLSLRDGTLDIQSLNFVAPGAITLGGKGRIANLAKAPAGQIDVSLQAQETPSLRALTRIFGFSEDVVKSKHLPALAPLDLRAVLSASREGAATDAALELSGHVGGSDIALVAKAKGSPAAPMEAEIDIAGSVTGDRPQASLVLLFPDLPQDRIVAAAGEQGTLSVKLAGIPNRQLTGRGALETQALQLSFDGNGAVRQEGLALNGFASVATEDASLALPLLGIDPPPSAQGVPLSIRANIAKEAGQVDLEQVKANVAGEPIEGNAHFDRVDALTRFDIAATGGRISLPALLGVLIAWERTDSTEEMLGAVGDNAAQVWPARGFSLGLLDDTQGTISLSAKTLSLSEPFPLRDGKLTAKVDGDGLAIQSIEGQLFGGTFLASGSLAPRGSGAALTAKTDLKGADLAALSKAVAGQPLATGPFDLELELAGEGLSPPGIVAGLDGKGALKLGGGELTSFTAKPLRQIAAKAARNNVPATSAEIDADAATIRAGLTKGSYAYAPADFDFDVKNGMLRFAPGTLSSKGVATALKTYVELASLRLDSEWRMRLTGPRNANVPPLDIVYAGRLDDAAAIAPAVGTAAIESQLTIERLQDDVERLERLDVTGRSAPGDQAREAEVRRAEEAKRAAEIAAREEAARQDAARLEAARQRAEADAARATAERAAAEKAARERAISEAEAAKERAAKEQAAKERAAKEQAAKEQADAKSAADAKASAAAAKAEAEAKTAAQRQEAARAAAEQAAAEKAAAEARAAAERAAQERAAAEAKAEAEAKAAAKARAAAQRAAKERAAAEAKAQADRAARARIEAEARAEAARAASEANAAARLQDGLLPPPPAGTRPGTEWPQIDANIAPGEDPIAEILEGDATDDALGESASEPEELAPPVRKRQRRRARRKARRDDWKRNYGIFGGGFGGR